jgi:hypothetical protein
MSYVRWVTAPNCSFNRAVVQEDLPTHRFAFALRPTRAKKGGGGCDSLTHCFITNLSRLRRGELRQCSIVSCRVVIRSLRLLAYLGIERDMQRSTSASLQATPMSRSSNASPARVKRESCQTLAGNARGKRNRGFWGDQARAGSPEGGYRCAAWRPGRGIGPPARPRGPPL